MNTGVTLTQGLAGLGMAAFTFAVATVRNWLNTHIKPKQFDTALNLARTAVTAAEQFGKDVGVSFTGPDKLKFATDAVVAGAKRVGLRLSNAEVNSFIHAALSELKGILQQPAQAQPGVDVSALLAEIAKTPEASSVPAAVGPDVPVTNGTAPAV